VDTLREGLVEGLRAARATEREVYDALDPGARDAVPGDGEWSPKDTLAHLAAWRSRQASVFAARREGRPDPRVPGAEIDDINAAFHDERADWSWDRVTADADTSLEELIAEVVAASDDVLDDPKNVASIMGDGPEHDLAHLGPLASGPGSPVLTLAETTHAILDRGGWPARAEAVARYNLACFHALGGNLDVARSLLRQALPAQDDLRELAPDDDDLVALRDEIPKLAAG
jgi:hypothetical protein